MTSKLKLTDIILIGIVIAMFYYLYIKTKTLNNKIEQTYNLVNYHQTLIGDQSQATSALNHEVKMLKNLFKNQEKIKDLNIADKTPKEFNLDVELSEELKELNENLEEDYELADPNEFEKQQNTEKLFENFIPSLEFKGHKLGFEFKKGENGMGYYRIINTNLQKPETGNNDELLQELGLGNAAFMMKVNLNKPVPPKEPDDGPVIEEIIEDHKTNPEPEPVKEVKPEPVKEVEPEPVKEVEPEPVKEVESEPVKEVESEPVKEVEPEPVKEIQIDTEPESQKSLPEPDKKQGQTPSKTNKKPRGRPKKEVIEVQNNTPTDISNVD
jgi:hypothetical protein